MFHPKEIDEAKKALFQAVGEALSAWADLEGNLGAVLSICNDPSEQTPGFKAFWSLQSFEARLSLCDAIICWRIKGNAKLETEWRALFNRLTDKNKKRNKLAHGQVVQHARNLAAGDLSQEVSFVPFYLSRALVKDLGWNDLEHLSLKQVREIGEGFYAASNRLARFYDTVYAHMLQQTASKGS